MDERNRWVVVNQFFPTERVCPDITDPAELYMSPYCTLEIAGSKQGYDTKKKAIKKAREVRNRSCWFEGYDELYDLYSDEEDSDNQCAKSSKEKIKENEPDLPWDSSDLENYDNDEENTIDVWRLSEFNAECERRNRIIKKAHMKHMNHLLRRYVSSLSTSPDV